MKLRRRFSNLTGHRARYGLSEPREGVRGTPNGGREISQFPVLGRERTQGVGQSYTGGMIGWKSKISAPTVPLSRMGPSIDTDRVPAL